MSEEIKSPCKNLCRYKDGFCTDCLRSFEEIASWAILDDKEKLQVLENIEKRRKEKGESYYGFP